MDKFSSKMLCQDEDVLTIEEDKSVIVAVAESETEAAGEQETGDEKDVILLNEDDGYFANLAGLINEPEGYKVTPRINKDGSGGVDVANSSTSSATDMQTGDTPSQVKFQHVSSNKTKSEVKKTVKKTQFFKDNQGASKKTFHSRILPEITQAVTKYKGQDRCEHNRRWDSCRGCSVGPKCYHGRRWRECPSCNSDCTVKCSHDMWKKKCSVCTPAAFCNCGKRKRDCEKCNACAHNKIMHKCYICSPQHFCPEHKDSQNEPMHKYKCKNKHPPCAHREVWYKCSLCGTSKGKGTKSPT